MKTKLKMNISKNWFAKRRRDLIPIWMKPFIFLFLLFGALGIYGIVKNTMGIASSSSLYGLESFTVFSLLGVFLKGIFFFKALTSFGLWMEKDWAVKFGIIDAVFGIVVCIMVMVVLPFVDFKDGINELNIRFELFLLVPYLYQLLKMKHQWENFNEFVAEEIQPLESYQNNSKVIEEDYKEIQIVPEEKIDKEDPSRFMPK